MLEKVYGKTRNPLVVNQLVSQLDQLNLTGTLYLGYPVLASADETVFVEALLVSDERGLVAFDIGQHVPAEADDAFWKTVQDSQDRLFYALANNLGRHQSLRERRHLGVTISVVTFFPDDVDAPNGWDIKVAGPTTVGTALADCPPVPPEYVRPLNAALQRVTTIKPSKKRSSVTRGDSRGAVLREIEKEIANLDQWQKRAAIESPEGPQRVRGLAGSGKTIVLALKAAYLHTQNPDWHIALTFHTRSLYQQFTELVRRFTYEHSNDEPDLTRLRVIHAWGSPSKAGIYAELADRCKVTPRDFIYARATYGLSDAFRGVCQELLTSVEAQTVEPIYDAILVDEAQDLPWPFFRLIYKFTKPPKRIVWAYDELQNLSEATMPPVEDLFGVDETGNARVQLTNTEGQPRQDLMLPVCYRNTPWALTLAHAIGFGIYRPAGLVQLFDDPGLWSEIGYEIVRGNLDHGQEVVLQRRGDSYPSYFDRLIDPNDAIVCEVFRDEREQAEHVARSIEQNLGDDELEPDDILVVLPDPITAKKKSKIIMDALARRDIASHLAGVTTSQDEIFSPDSVSISNIYRAKGNEAPMVYVLNCQYCVTGHELIRARNTLFTAITRSRAWVRLCGCGPFMGRFMREVDAVRSRDYRLHFQIPTPPELERLQMIHRDRTADERARIRKAEKGLASFLEEYSKGELAFENLPPELRDGLKDLIQDAEKREKE